MDGTIHYIQQTMSTQYEARLLVGRGIAKMGDAVVADRQICGRGRFGRGWISPYGGLYVTVILPADALLSLKSGLALVRALRTVSIPAGLKWPNDVLVDDRKIGGILIESDGGRSLVGVGLNLTKAPLDTATCVSQYTDAVDRDEWARGSIRELIKVSEEPLDLDAYRSACLTLGRPVRIEAVADHSKIEGVATDIDENGRLIVMTGNEETFVSSGECFHLRTVDLTVDRVVEPQ